jgi:Zn-dependent protease
MRRSLRLGKVSGIPVEVHWTVAVILAIMADILGADVLPATLPHQPTAVYWALAAAAALAFLGSLLIHELAHALVARRNGVGVYSITLWLLGGMTELDREPASPGTDVRIALAGPAASMAEAVLFGGLALGVSRAGDAPVAATAAAWLAVMNGLIAVFNLLPGAPLDGGRVLRAALWRRYRDQTRAELAAARAGLYLGFVIIAAGVAKLLVWASLDGTWLMVIGLFLASAASTEERVALATSALAGLRVADVMTADPSVAAGWSTVQDFLDNSAMRARQNAFPVIGSDGQLTGVVITSQLARIRPADQSAVRLDEVALSVPPRYLAAPGDPAEPLLTRPPLGGEVSAVVHDHGRVVGLVSASDLGQAVRRAMLRRAPSREPAGGRGARDHAVLSAGARGPRGWGAWCRQAAQGGARRVPGRSAHTTGSKGPGSRRGLGGRLGAMTTNFAEHVMTRSGLPYRRPPEPALLIGCLDAFRKADRAAAARPGLLWSR